MNLDELKQQIATLSEADRKRLLSDLHIEHYESGDYVAKAQKDKEEKAALNCPYCSSSEYISRGSYKGVKRYQCKSCKRYFNSNSGTALYHIHKKDKWQQYIECMNKGYSLRKSAKVVGISYRTSFNWRHKILSTLPEVEPAKLGGIVEADDTYFPNSEKGNRNLDRKARKRGDARMIDKENKIPVIVATDRKGNTILKVASKGSLKVKDLKEQLAGKFEEGTILCSDGANAYKGLAKQEGIEHLKVARLGRPIAKMKPFNIQTVNQLHKELKHFMGGFHGVSTKYLQNYMNWFMQAKRRMADQDKVKQWIWLTMTYVSALEMYLNIKSGASLYIS